MGSKPFSQPTSQTEALDKVLPFLNMSNSALFLSRLSQSFQKRYPEYMEPHYSRWNPIIHLYERAIFSRGGDIPPPTPESICQQRTFWPNVNLSSGEIKQPDGMNIHVFTNSESKKPHLEDIVSMVIEMPLVNDIKEDYQKKNHKNVMEATNFVLTFLLTEDVEDELQLSKGVGESGLPRTTEQLQRLRSHRLKNLKNLKLSGIWIGGFLWLISSYFDLDRIHCTCSPLDPFPHRFEPLTSLKKLHLEFRENFKSINFPSLPSSLEELSLHLSNLKNDDDHPLFISHCKCLRKM